MTIDFERRRAVMERSRKLGHCICNPKHPCPCPPLIEQNVCPCAGERLPVKPGQAALTRYVRKAGCASKIGQADLNRLLEGLPQPEDPNVLIGTAAGDDAGVYRIDDRTALVQTVDVFTPCVNDARLFGRIAAANSVSDIYAMGGRPITALSIVGFPIETLDGAILREMLLGGIETLEEAGCALIGGHSINDEEIKCGFAVTGLIDPRRPISRDRARPGDLLILTKPLGTGIVSFAAQLGVIEESAIDEAGQWMATLNRDASEAMVRHNAHACTDVTGFGLAGHLVAMVRGSGVNAEIDLSAVPVLAAVPACLKHEIFGGAVDRNQAYAMSWIDVLDGAGKEGLPVLFDPQTSGGLLIALAPEDAQAFIEEMEGLGHTAVAVIGRISEKDRAEPEGRVIVTNARLGGFVGTEVEVDLSRLSRFPEEPPAPAAESDIGAACCDSPPEIDTPAPPRTHGVSDMDPFDSFKAFMKEANAPGLIDAKNKRLMAIVLSLAHHCHPCLKIHLQGAVQMGISKAEIDEAARLAVAFGGCTTMMFYKDVCREVGL